MGKSWLCGSMWLKLVVDGWASGTCCRTGFRRFGRTKLWAWTLFATSPSRFIYQKWTSWIFLVNAGATVNSVDYHAATPLITLVLKVCTHAQWRKNLLRIIAFCEGWNTYWILGRTLKRVIIMDRRNRCDARVLRRTLDCSKCWFRYPGYWWKRRVASCA